MIRHAAFVFLACLWTQAALAVPEIGEFAEFERVSARRVSRAVVEYEYRAVLSLPDANAIGVVATVSSLSNGTVVVDEALEFGDLDAPGQHASLDTFSFRQDRRVPFDPAALLIDLNWQNRPPTAAAGPDRTVDVGQTLSLDGSGSTDPDGDPLDYEWTIVSSPPGSQALLSNPFGALTELNADQPGRYVIELVVSDGLELSLADPVTIDTNNSLPSANAGPDQTARVGEIVVLDGSASSDADGDLLTYRWRAVSAPLGSAAAPSNPGAIMPSVLVDRAGSYVFELVVDDGTGESAPDTVRIDTENSAPVAAPGPDQTVRVGEMALLDASASSDADGDPLEYTWALISRPLGSTAALDDPSAIDPTFLVDEPGNYVVQLIVSDGALQSTPATLRVVTENSAPLALAGPDQTGSVGLIRLDGSGSRDVDGDPLTYQWSLIALPPGSSASLADQNTVQTEFQADVVGDYVVQLIVDDGVLESAPDTALIRITSLPSLTVFVTSRVGGGLQVAGSGTLGSTNHGGVSVRIESWDPSSLLIAPDAETPGSEQVDLFVPDGVRDYAFVVQGVPRQVAIVEVVASAPGFEGASRTVEIAPPGLSFAALTNPVSAGLREGFIVFSGVLDAGGTGLSSQQGVSAAALPQTLTLRSDAPSVGDLSLGGTTGDVVVLELEAGDFQTLVTFNALGAGTAEITAELADSATLATFSESVVVDPPDISVFSRTLGAGLQFSSQGSLGLSDHGGVTVRIESSDPGLARVSADDTTPGSAFVDIFVPDGESAVPFTVQAVANTTGSAVLTASSPGFDPGTGTITVAQPGVALTALSSQLEVGQSDTFALFTGVANAAGTGLSSLQRVSAGNDLELTLESTDASVGALSWDGETGSIVTRTIVAPEFQFSPALNAIGPGTTVIRASIPGFLFVPGDMSVDVIAPSQN